MSIHPTTEKTLFEVKQLSKHFVTKRNFWGRAVQILPAIADIDLTIDDGETLGLVGESGCGKSTFARVALRLLEPTSGQILFEGQDITRISQNALRPFRRQAQLIFQDPYSSLNPKMTVKQTLREVLRVHKIAKTRRDATTRAVELMERVGLSADDLKKYPYAFSGGQRQRIGIARALAVGPKLIFADEAVSALDVSIQAQIINLLQDLKQQEHMSYVFISHDLRVVRHISDRVAVMYLGRIVELARTDTLFNTPQHPYTQALLQAVPVPDPNRKRERLVLAGDMPNPVNPPKGCPFHPRCPLYEPGLCDANRPELRTLSTGAKVACHKV